MKPPIRPVPFYRLQRGAVLFVSLMFLILLILLGMTASSRAVLQESMTGSMRNGQMALMGAESALRGAEFNLWIAAQTSAAGNKLTLYCSFDGGGGCYMPDGGNNFLSTTSAFSTATAWSPSTVGGGTTYTLALTGQNGSSLSANLAEQPQYLIKMLGPDLPPGSTGRSGGSLLQQNGGPNNQTKYIYSITARSPGGNANTLRVAQSTFASIKPSY